MLVSLSVIRLETVQTLHSLRTLLRAQCKHETVLTGGCTPVYCCLRGASTLVLCPSIANVPEEVLEPFRELATKGKYPQKSGKARARKLTAEQRSDIAK